MFTKYENWFDENRETLLEDFFAFLRFPSVSADPKYERGVLECSEYLRIYLEKGGFDVEIWETLTYPTLFASSLSAGPSKPTLLFYQHYDVQPPDPLELWESPPFEPTIRDGHIYARGAIDNKGQCFYVMAALCAFLKERGKDALNLKVLIEGEEETGSVGVREILENKRDRLRADHLFITDCSMLSETEPAVTLGVRGVLPIEVKCRNSEKDLHSGEFGGVSFNPARALVKALNSCFNEKGEVAIPGFYDAVESLSIEEKNALYWNFDPKASGAKMGIRAFDGEEGYSLVESNWIRPTLEINGLTSGYQGEGTKTIIPAEAKAKLSCRLVLRQDPKKIGELVATFLKKSLPQEMEIEVNVGLGSEGFITTPQSKTVEVAKKAYEEIFRTRCRAILTGATLPIASLLAAVGGGELILMGVGLAKDGMHAPNERIGLDRLKKGFLVTMRLLEIFAKDGCH